MGSFPEWIRFSDGALTTLGVHFAPMALRFVTHLLRFACAAAVVACGSRTDLVASHDDAGSPDADAVASAPDAATHDAHQIPPALAMSDGTFTDMCGPADGPAFELFFTAAALTCNGNTPSDYDDVNIYRGLTGPQTFSFTPNGPNGIGEGESCTAGTCVQATHVTLEVTAFTSTGTTAAGQYTLVLEDGTTVSKTFVVNVCPSMLLCG